MRHNFRHTIDRYADCKKLVKFHAFIKKNEDKINDLQGFYAIYLNKVRGPKHHFYPGDKVIVIDGDLKGRTFKVLECFKYNNSVLLDTSLYSKPKDRQRKPLELKPFRSSSLRLIDPFRKYFFTRQCTHQNSEMYKRVSLSDGTVIPKPPGDVDIQEGEIYTLQNPPSARDIEECKLYLEQREKSSYLSRLKSTLTNMFGFTN
ncbi:hypothetical protein RF11_01962 [Thelohanellus kitauei]|uniref:39S ribosomal protein L24, mitochondrial n=1 Tax=Thelohanellus kitauei TaxID=669202 RepID=A0A0C2ML62_THEKT|nr:hypothetical protein RF11_01962 [Thelohanellus kitauei]